MKDLLEEYGGFVISILGAMIIVILLIYMCCSPNDGNGLKGILGEKIMSILDKGV